MLILENTILGKGKKNDFTSFYPTGVCNIGSDLF